MRTVFFFCCVDGLGYFCRVGETPVFLARWLFSLVNGVLLGISFSDPVFVYPVLELVQGLNQDWRLELETVAFNAGLG